MERHLGTASDAEWNILHAYLVGWLSTCRMAGCVPNDYSLYRALDDERARAQQARVAPVMEPDEDTLWGV